MYTEATDAALAQAVQRREMEANKPRLRPPSRFACAATIFLSSVLLFLIQPIIGKQLLPLFGGAAAVWATCLVFFQSLLLIGYFYAHLLTRLPRPKLSIAIHLLLLFASLAAMFVPAGHSSAGALTHPVFECLRMIARNAGLPYFVLASTTPLIQAWYAGTRRAAIPYRLFALSNFGSLLALIAYPFGLERLLNISAQLTIWRGAYFIFAVFCCSVAIRTLKYNTDANSDSTRLSGKRHVDWRQRWTWMALAASSSALLMAVTNTLCQNIASVPLLWIAPLALYLLSFVFCFDRDGLFRPAPYRVLVPLALTALVWVSSDGDVNGRIAVAVCLAGLFVVCMFCHGQLSMLKPASRELTAFYLCISAGGAVGGAFVGLLAPALFSGFFELNFAIAAGLVLSLRFLFGYRSAAFLLACGVTAVIALGVVGALDRGVTTFRGRNFYGVVSIREHMDDRGNRTRSLVHGRVIHGGQKLDGPNRLEPTFYYGRESGVGIAIQRHVPHHRVGVVGLGAGTLATYGGFGEYYRFYEINPMVAELASSKFTFLHDSKARVELVIGDARLSLEREPDEHFDTLVLDAFSGDSIPMHLLTYEAFKCYFRHLNQDGVIAVHVSNRFLDLRPVAADIAARFHRTAVLVQSAAKPGQDISLAEWILITTHRPLLAQLEAQKRGNPIRPTGHRLWTDQFSNILEVLR